MAKQFYSLAVKALKRETVNTVSIIFDIPEELKNEFSYEAGQYLTIRATINGEEIRRSYSISSYTTTDEELQISCKMIDGGKMSTYLFREVGIGDQLDVMPPDGRFLLEKGASPLVLFAAGSGITPIISILKKAITEEERVVYLFYGNRTSDEIIFKESLKELQTNYVDRLLVQHFLSGNGERLDIERTKGLLNGINGVEGAQFYICGPVGMIEAVKEGLVSSSIDVNNIHIEYFVTPTSTTQPSEVIVEGEVNDITVILDEEEHKLTVNKGESVLDASSRIGIDPPFSCQSGVCTTCRAKVLRGKVEMENNFGLSEEEVEEGYVLTCISTPKSAGVLISWDED